MKFHRIIAMLVSGVTILGATTAAAQQATGSTTDPRAGLKAGKYDAGIASK